MMATNAPSADIKSMLITAGVGSCTPTADWSVHTGREPPTPDKCITVYDTGGYDPSPKWRHDQPTVQVRVRADTHANAWAKAFAARDALLGKAADTVGGTYYVGIWAQGDIASLGYDDNGRALMVFNLRICRQPATSTNRT